MFHTLKIIGAFLISLLCLGLGMVAVNAFMIHIINPLIPFALIAGAGLLIYMVCFERVKVRSFIRTLIKYPHLIGLIFFAAVFVWVTICEPLTVFGIIGGTLGGLYLRLKFMKN